MSVAIKFENISKQYRLGEVGTGTLSHDLHRAWAKLRGKPDPFAKVGSINDRTVVGGEYVYALKDINFEVKQGEILGIVGRNGAGKSTLLKLLSRVTAPSTGSIKAKGRIASLLEVGTGFHPELTGRENIYLNGAILGMRRHEITKQLEEIVEFSGCAKYIDTPVKRYSSGMTVRLGFAVAAHLDCEILIVDEVLAVGDVEFQKKCLGKMKDVSQGQGRTVLFVSHNMAAVRTLCTHGLFLTSGQACFISSIENTINQYVESSIPNAETHTFALPTPNIACDLTLRSMVILRNGEPGFQFEFGDKISFVVDFEAKTPIQKPLIGFLIRAIKGGDAVNANNYFLPSTQFPQPVKAGTMRCDLGEVPLMAGKYVVSLWIGRHVHEQHYIEDAGVFNVEERDIWKTGKLPTSGLSLLWWPTQFSFTTLNNAT